MKRPKGRFFCLFFGGTKPLKTLNFAIIGDTPVTISRSSAIALAIIASKLGAGKEMQAIKMLEKINPNCRPNKSMAWMKDEILNRNMVLYKTAFENIWLNN